MPMELSGMSQLLSNLQQRFKITEELAREALHAGAEVLKVKMEELAPRSSFQGEHLADHIIITAIRNGTLDVGPHKDFFYAHFLEFGTSKMPAHPFAQPAFEACKEQVQMAMMNVIRRGLRI
ncbi:hypothetical protein GCM10008967_00350 [Bacillus carboniphilus]|uniref:HK97 gp10 family phage protein n=1 Tax=Bacillus carboniphilus TaxID=86663 RepID=A0ABN0VP85_9BACI